MFKFEVDLWGLELVLMDKAAMDYEKEVGRSMFYVTPLQRFFCHVFAFLNNPIQYIYYKDFVCFYENGVRRTLIFPPIRPF
ncbi:MAG: hypothetical protein H6R19_2477 [Proteobacteria bacterium]|nr:hypothetical protein [Pseudomonadota bacterium]